MTDGGEAIAGASGRPVRVQAGAVELEGELAVPPGARGLVVFAHGSGSSRHSPRNRFVARHLQAVGLGTLLFDLLTPAEERVDLVTREFRFDIPLLARRLVGAVAWVGGQPEVQGLALGCFGASTGAAAALIAAAAAPDRVAAVVSRGGRVDLAGEALERVEAPTLMIVGERDTIVLDLNRQAYARMHCEREIAIVPGASHLFEEPGALEQVADLAAAWFLRHLGPATGTGM